MKHRTRRTAGLLAFLLVLLTVFSLPVSAAESVPNVAAEAYILVDMTTGEVLAEKNSEERLYPASTTKMMTAILALENLDLNKTWTADQEVYATGGSRLTLINAEECRIGDVLYATMVKSANDGAVFLGKAVTGTLNGDKGSTEQFVQMMNDKAAALGCTNTHFVNPNGLHDEDHYSCAADLSKIGLYCMQNETFRDIVKTTQYTMPATSLSGERVVNNTNLMLYDCTDTNSVVVGGQVRVCKYDGCIGIKTGYTPEAQGCLVSAAERDGTSLLCVVLKSTTLGRFADSIALLDWGFENYRTQQVLFSDVIVGEAQIRRGAVKSVQVKTKDELTMTLPVSVSDNLIQQEVEIFEDVTAPVEEGQVLGKLTLLEGGLPIGEYDLIAVNAVEKGTFLSVFGVEDVVAHKIFRWVGGIFAFIILGGFAFVMIMHEISVQKKKKKAAAKAARLKAEQEAARAAEEARKQAWFENYRNRYRDDDRE